MIISLSESHEYSANSPNQRPTIECFLILVVKPYLDLPKNGIVENKGINNLREETHWPLLPAAFAFPQF